MTKKTRGTKPPSSFALDPSRVIVIAGGIDWDTVTQVGMGLAHYADSPLPVLVRIGSPGGKLAAGLAIHDMLACNPAPIVTEAVGLAGSSGALIFQAGHVRLMMPNARLLIHEGSLDLENVTLDAADTAMMRKEILDRNRHIARLLAKRTGAKVKEVRKLLAESTTFTAREAVKRGFADGVSQTTSAAEAFARAAAYGAALAAAAEGSPSDAD